MTHPKPVVLCILDGWGISDRPEQSAPDQADTPNFDRLMRECPNATLVTFGPDVGLPKGQMGNSEVGHTNIGAGRVVAMDLGQIDLAIEDGSFYSNTGLGDFIAKLKATGGTAHLMGVVSDGGVHGHIQHVVAAARAIADKGVPVVLHAITDGRDVPPKSAMGFITELRGDLPRSVEIGTVTGRGQSTVPGYLTDEAGKIPLLGGIAEPNFEAIGKAKPDLIVVDGTSINNNPPMIEALRAIAPTAFVGYAGGDWRYTFKTLANVVNKQADAKQVLADYDAKVATVKKGLDRYAGKTFSIVRWQGSSAALILKELPPGRALSDLGLKRPKNQDKEGRGHSEPVSRENLAEIDADWMFFGTLGGSSVDNRKAGGGTDTEAAKQALAEAEKAPGFTSLKAYRSGHIILVDGSRWTSTGGPLLMSKIVADVERDLVQERR